MFFERLVSRMFELRDHTPRALRAIRMLSCKLSHITDVIIGVLFKKAAEERGRKIDAASFLTKSRTST